jgi:hypothetical protein
LKSLLFIFVLLLFLPENSSGQNFKFKRTFDAEELPADDGKPDNIFIDQPYVIALSYFPELNSTRIKFREKKLKTTMSARPSFGSVIFNSRKNRSYIIRVNNSHREGRIISRNVPYNALIGLYGHELSHISDYSDKNILKIILTGLRYTNKRSKAKYEKGIDKKTIERGLGWQLYDWSDFVLNYSDAIEKYKNFKKAIYLEPFEIEDFINADLSYEDSR